MERNNIFICFEIGNIKNVLGNGTQLLKNKLLENEI
jgi:hypothetical protein